ncbi:MAG: hypothetical protein ACQEVA_20940 [Myxococcota bacterium]
MNAEESDTHVPEDADPEASFRETHRPFVRELNRDFASVYGFGGAAVLLVTAAVPLVGWFLSALASPITWSVCVTVLLVSIFVLRAFVRRRARRYRTAIDDYCRVNEIDAQRLREAYIDENMYPYFEAIFETIERREELLAESNE